MAQIKGHNSDINVRTMSCDNINEDLVNMNAYIKFGETPSISSQDIERKRNLALIKGHNSGTNEQK